MPSNPPLRSGGSSGGGSGSSGASTAPAKSAQPAAKPAAPAKPVVKQTGDKSKDMAAFAKANPKLAAAKAERDRTRGTSASTNPLMSRFKKSPARTAELAKLRADAKAKSMAQSAENKTRGPQRRGSRFEENEFELVVQHLVSEGIAESADGALIMLEGMSEEFITNILEQMQMGAAIVEFLIQNGEAESIDEANYIISEMDEENIKLLINQIEKQPVDEMKTTARMTATGEEPAGDKLLRRVKDFIMGSPKGDKLKSTPKK